MILAEDGVAVDLVNHHAKVTGKVPAGYVYVAGADVGGVTEASLKGPDGPDLSNRRCVIAWLVSAGAGSPIVIALATEGVITVVIVDTDTGKLAEPPDFLARGFPHDKATFSSAVTAIQTVLQTAAREGIGESHQLEQLITWTAR